MFSFVFNKTREVVMSGKKMNKSFPIRTVVVLICVAGLASFSAWLLSTPDLKASSGLPSLTFTSPINNPKFGLAKTVDNSAPAPGGQIIYTLAYSNTNPGSQAFNVRLYDFLPAGVQLVSTDPPVAPSDGVLLFTIPSVGPGTENHAVTVRVNVLDGYDQLYNHALIVADYVTPTHASLLTSVTQPSPGLLRLTKTGPSYALVNGQLVYTLRCENIGDVTISGVMLADVLPTGLPLLGASPSPDVATPPVVRWSLGDLAPGASRTVVITSTAPAATGVITNTAVADARQLPMTLTVFSTQVISQGAILRVTKDASAPSVTIGGQLVYTLRYWNAGNQLATSVILTDTLPSDITVTASPSPDSLTSQQAVWRFDVLGAGVEGQIVMTATVVGEAWNRTLRNVANITGQAGSYPDRAELDTPVRPLMLYLPLVMKQH
jgi:uncharacterized repeat protein (TIGR01451 family)